MKSLTITLVYPSDIDFIEVINKGLANTPYKVYGTDPTVLGQIQVLVIEKEIK